MYVIAASATVVLQILNTKNYPALTHSRAHETGLYEFDCHFFLSMVSKNVLVVFAIFIPPSLTSRKCIALNFVRTIRTVCVRAYPKVNAQLKQKAKKKIKC